MALEVGTVMETALGARLCWETVITTDHNHVAHERHGERELWVHRKGAMPARLGEGGVLPGSMGSLSFHVEGRGHEQALCSSAHGAGRALSRTAAREKVTERELRRQMGTPRPSRRDSDRARDERSTWSSGGRSSPEALSSPVAQLELDAIALAQHVDALAVNGAGMKEHLFAGGISNKAESFVCSQCPDGSCHSLTRSCLDLREVSCRYSAVTRKTKRSPGSGDLSLQVFWLRGQDLNLRPLGYEPNELPDCSTPRQEP